MIHDRLKQIIFKKLYKDLSHVEIIPHEKSIWFIDREEKYWYLEYEKPDMLWWRWGYFTDFFTLFSIETEEFKWVLSEWVEEVLNCKVKTPIQQEWALSNMVEEVLNCKVKTPLFLPGVYTNQVEEVLNYKVNTHVEANAPYQVKVEEVLDYNVNN